MLRPNILIPILSVTQAPAAANEEQVGEIRSVVTWGNIPAGFFGEILSVVLKIVVN